MFFSRQHLHFAGIGGIGMSGIAEVLLNLGYTISGSDLRLTPTTDRLVQLGATVYEGHDAENVAGAKALVVSSAVDESNPEVQEARRARRTALRVERQPRPRRQQQEEHHAAHDAAEDPVEARSPLPQPA